MTAVPVEGARTLACRLAARFNRHSAFSAVMAGLVIEVGLARLQLVQRGTRLQPSSVAIPMNRGALPIGITGTRLLPSS
ncbi:hypothetical protein CHELA40_10707 [Chelatococcus asaccharovorans]|nr:hypothetical protein CHELA40_10707 [Chelatococcus asaccharovorans]CAH1686223.1 hypothetical protein CHELA17_64899 [Chelatococcus asaccharovorans]